MRSGRTIIRRPRLRAFINTTFGPPQPRPACNSPRRAATAGVEAMDRLLKALNAALEAIRDVAVNALTQIDKSQATGGFA
jgi:hypothetical protein